MAGRPATSNLIHPERFEQERSNGAPSEVERIEVAAAERRALEAEARAAALDEKLKRTGEALVDANQELAQMPLLKHRLAEMYDRNAGLEAQVNSLLGSRSWRVTSFLRNLSHALKLQR